MQPFTLRHLAFSVVLVAAALWPAGASAEPTYQYAAYNEVRSNYSNVSVFRIDQSKSITVRLVRGMSALARTDSPAGVASGFLSYSGLLQPGDVVEVYQPQTANPVPNTAPVETWTAPPLTVSGPAGASAISGNNGIGSAVRVRTSRPCAEFGQQASFATVAGGAYNAALTAPLEAGSYFSVIEIEPDNDTLQISDRVPGDAFCTYVAATDGYGPYPDPTPYAVEVDGLDKSVIATTRIELTRNGTVEASEDDDDLDLTPAKKPLPGDVIHIYRPHDAPAPVKSVVVPGASAIFDPGNDMVAVDTALPGFVGASACTVFDCAMRSERALQNAPAGRTLFSFAEPFAWYPAFDIQPDSIVHGFWTSEDWKLTYRFNAVPGDLTAPVGKITLAKKLKLKKIGKRIRFRLSSSEAGTIVSKLTTAAPKRARKKKRGRKSAVKQVTLASTRTSVKAGSNRVSMKVSRSGRKAIKKLIAARKTQSATLTITLKDASGNVTTVVKSTKLALK